MSDPITVEAVKMEGGWLMLYPQKEDRGRAMALVRKLSGKKISADIRQYRKKRSLDANAYAWVLIHKLAENQKITPIEVYRSAIRDVAASWTPLCVREADTEKVCKAWGRNGLGWITEDLGPNTVPGCRTIMAYHGSSTFDRAQMARLLDFLIQDCTALDIETRPEEEIRSLLEGWDA